MSFVSSLIGGVLGSNAAGKASNAEVTGAQQAQQLLQNNQQNAQNFQNDVWGGTKSAEQPYQQLGAGAAGGLGSLLSKGFQAPTLAQAEQTPGFQFNLEQGARAIDQNAAANGTLMSGNTGTALQKFGQGLAETTYQQDYNNVLNGFMANYQSLLGGTNAGLQSTGQLASAGQSAAGNMAGIDLTGGEQQAQQLNNAAAARASGYLGKANAWGNALGGMGGGIQQGIGNMDFTGGSNPLEMAGQFLGF